MNYPPYAPHPQPQPTREKPQYSIRELVFAFVFLFVALLFSFAMPFRERPLAVLLLSIVLFVQTALYHGKGAIVKKRRPITMLVLYGVFLIPFLTNANATLRFFVFVLLMLLLAFFWYDKAVLLHQPMEDATVASHVGDALLSYVSHFHVMFAVIFSTTGRGERAKKGFRTFGFIMLGLGIALLPTVIIWALLSYDDAFNLLMDNIFDFSFEKIFERIWDIIVAVPLGAAFFSLVYSAKAERKEKAVKASRSGGVPRALLYAAVTPMLVLYALFFFSQKDYYLSAFTKTLPEGLTFAEYAREGFFQLCVIACINAAVLLVFSLLARKKEGSKEILCRVYQGVLSFFTLILIATALSKMALYIDTYGLTHKRVYASWLMALLAFVFVVILGKQFARRLPFVKVAIVGAVLFFALITLPNIDAVIANYNVDRYLDGTLDTVDIDELEDLGISSVKARIRLEEAWEKEGGLLGTSSLTSEEKEGLTKLSASLDREKENLDRSLWAFSIPNSQAKRLLDERE